MLRRHTISVQHALDGLIWAFRTQPNFRVHTVVSLIAIILGMFLSLTPIEWVVIIFTISLGIVIELLNTSIEAATDLITDQFHRLAKVTKDTAAAAMLVYAFGAVLVGIVIFLPKLLVLLF